MLIVRNVKSCIGKAEVLRSKLEIEVTRRKPGQYDRVETWEGHVPIELLPTEGEDRFPILIGDLDDGVVIYASELVEALNKLGVVGVQQV